MYNRTSTYLMVLNGAICGFFFIYSFVLGHFFTSSRTLRNDVVQGILIGFALAFVLSQIYARIKTTKINGWITMFGLGEPGNGMFLRAAHAQIFPGPVNVPQEAMYWTTSGDGAGHTALRKARLHHTLPTGRSSAEQCILVFDDGRCAKSLCAEFAQSVQRQRSLRPPAERRRLR